MNAKSPLRIEWEENFDSYRLIRHPEAPKAIDVHFVKNEIDPTGLGEPPFPPVFGALANALCRATGERLHAQPFADKLESRDRSG
jgi:isoquinoline 1-oxidoreductase beta subunit